MSLLDLKDITLKDGGLTAVNALSLKLEEGQVFAPVGPNGAGKSTVFNLISRLYTPASVSIRFDGQDLPRVGWPPPASRASSGRLSCCTRPRFCKTFWWGATATAARACCATSCFARQSGPKNAPIVTP